jgi:hypothetical protein
MPLGPTLATLRNPDPLAVAALDLGWTRLRRPLIPWLSPRVHPNRPSFFTTGLGVSAATFPGRTGSN